MGRALSWHGRRQPDEGHRRADPFGGVKQSGLGREGARHGMEAFIDVKYVCRDAAWALTLTRKRTSTMLEESIDSTAWDRDNFFHPSTHLASMRAAS